MTNCVCLFVVPTVAQLEEANKICDTVVQLKKKHYGERGLTSKVDKLVELFVNQLYGLDEEDMLEIQIWFKRRYPRFGQEKIEVFSSTSLSHQESFFNNSVEGLMN